MKKTMVRKYNKFSAKEKEAIKKGTETYGTKWSLILRSNKDVLGKRTGAQIKVCNLPSNREFFGIS